MGELYPRHEKRTKNPAETTGNRYEIEILMSRTQKLKGLVAASLRVKNIKRQSLIRESPATETVESMPPLYRKSICVSLRLSYFPHSMCLRFRFLGIWSACHIELNIYDLDP